jgi:metal-responsive CopG/Arc/MetJ family transcriptional regulator
MIFLKGSRLIEMLLHEVRKFMANAHDVSRSEAIRRLVELGLKVKGK